MAPKSQQDNVYDDGGIKSNRKQPPLLSTSSVSSNSSIDDEQSNINISTSSTRLAWWLTSSKKASMVASAAAIFAVATMTTFAPHANAAAAASTSATAVMANSQVWLNSLTETGFYQAFSLVFLSEIGDKTFFIAGLLAMKTSRFISFLGSMAALAVMTIISVLIGQVFHVIPSGLLGGEGSLPWDDVAACIAFAFFGFKTLKEALEMEEGESIMNEELAEAEEAVDSSRVVGAADGAAVDNKKKNLFLGQLASIFALVFAAEFGDRSFLSTIALSAAQNPVSVAAGAIAAHAAATGIAVSSGSIVAKYISERVIGVIGGTLFLVFAVTTALGIF
jgi:putative Ca2+/H+ antiporter (TMEM165/GDT1 family)